MRHVQIKIYGTVKGVGFRWAAAKQAEKLGVFGFVKNDPAGFVYIEVEGNDLNVQQFVNWCAKGPSQAEVTNVEVVEGEAKGFYNFSIV